MVHFRGTPEGKTQVLAGNIEVLACNVSEVAEDIKAGQFRILGVMSAERSPFIPNGPTFREQGFNEVWAVSRGIAAPADLPKDVETALIGYLEKRRAYIPDYEQRQRAGLWIASTRVEKYNDWAVSARCKHQGMSWSPQGVLALAALEAARRNGELDAWRRDRALPERPLPAARPVVLWRP